jgi:Flp pilus assembly protein TadG
MIEKTIAWWQRQRRSGFPCFRPKLEALQEEQGQSLVLIVLALIGLLGFVGLGIDLGLVYVERVETGRAADASALAAVAELPSEQAAHECALVYLQDNGYDFQAAEAQVAYDTYQDGNYTADPGGKTTIWIDTDYSEDPTIGLPAYRVRVRVRQYVPTNFMQFLGFGEIPVEAVAEAEKVQHQDVVIVFDRSGSMEFDTLCYGCWEASSDEEVQYPDGNIYPLPWSLREESEGGNKEPPPDHCAGWVPNDPYNPDNGGHYDCGAYSPSSVLGGDWHENNCNYCDDSDGDGCDEDDDRYIVIEAEEYSSLHQEPYDPDAYVRYMTYWVMQRNDYNYDPNVNRPVGAIGRDDRGAYLSHHPYASYQDTTGFGVPCVEGDVEDGVCRKNLPTGQHWDAPRADYDFYVPKTGDYYIWIRGQGGHWGGNKHIFWSMDGDLTHVDRVGGFPTGPYYDGAQDNRWEWQRLGVVTGLSQGTAHTLHLWAGGAGFDVDRIIITTDDEDNAYYLPLKSATANNGRTDMACHPCDERFAGRPGGHEWSDSNPPEPYWRPDCSLDKTNRENAPIFDGERPIRVAQFSAREYFIIPYLDPAFDQIGVVSYSSYASIDSELECLRRRGPETLDDPDCDRSWRNPGHEPPRHPACGCFPGVITDTVLYEMDQMTANGSTNIADGIRRGISVLKTVQDGFGQHYGRPGAEPLMVLMTDGEANMVPSGDPDGCHDDDLWPHNTNDPSIDNAKDCVVYYALEARKWNIRIDTLTLGGADQELMQYVSDLTGGTKRHTNEANEETMKDLFEKIAEERLIRLIE